MIIYRLYVFITNCQPFTNLLDPGRGSFFLVVGIEKATNKIKCVLMINKLPTDQIKDKIKGTLYKCTYNVCVDTQGTKKSSGTSRFPSGQVTFYFHSPNGQGSGKSSGK